MTDARAPLVAPAATPLAPPTEFLSALADIGVSLEPPQLARLGDYLARLLAMNARMNLTAITDEVAVWTRHALDALTLVPLLSHVPSGAAVLDVGSGGGVPGIPLAIARPDLSFTLVEATQKKAAFLTEVAAALELPRVTVVAERAEVLVKAGSRTGAYAAVTARAVAKIKELVPLTAPFVAPSGLLLFIKGQRADDELAEAKKLLTRHGCTHERTVPTPTGRVVVLRVR